jgi:hypothetical protein
MSSVVDGKSFAGIAATTAAFNLKGGKYAVLMIATGGAGTMGLQALMPDGTTWQPLFTAFATTTGGFANVDVPPGSYRFQVTGFTGVSAIVNGVPS